MAYMKGLMMAAKGCEQLLFRDAYFSDIWFSGLKTADETVAEGVDFCGPVKTRHEGFCLSTLEKSTKEWPVGYHIVMNITPIVPGDRPILAIGYK